MNEQSVTNNSNTSVNSSRFVTTKPSTGQTHWGCGSPDGEGLNLTPPSSDKDLNPHDKRVDGSTRSKESDDEYSK